MINTYHGTEDEGAKMLALLQEEHVKMLAFVRANIDEWTISNTTRLSQVSLESTENDVEQLHNSSASGTSFQEIYTCLPNTDSIRLLRLHGTSFEDDPVHCTLLVHGLHDPCRPIFEAFSYTWADSQGNSSLCENIFVGPQYNVLPVTKNCLAALRCFRTAADRLLWVDAICINQFDLKERSHQVSLMRDVYTSAARVLTYLGDMDELLGDLIGQPPYDPSQHSNYYKISAADMSAVLRLPYFSRIWVIQEVLLNETATLTVGKHTLHWQQFRELAQNSLPSPDLTSVLISKNPSHTKMDWMRLLSWLKATKDCRCGDLRDRVYGLMGLTPWEDRTNLPVDYSISKQQLFIGLAMYWLTREDKNEQLISAVLDLALLPKVTPFLPSWTPDWTPQSPTDVDRWPSSSTPLTIRFDTTSIERLSSGLIWLNSSMGSEHANGNVRWTLDEAFWSEFISEHKFTQIVGYKPRHSVLPLSLGGTLALEAVHVLSGFMGKLKLFDTNGKPLHGLQLANFGNNEPSEKEFPQDGFDLHVLLDWKEALALRKHAHAVYSLQRRFRIVCAPPLAQDPFHYGSLFDIGTRLEIFEAGIIEHWLLDLFFYSTCAGSAYPDASRELKERRYWWKAFPGASAASQALSLSFETQFEEDRCRSITAVMTEISEATRHSIGETEVPWERHIDLKFLDSDFSLRTSFGSRAQLFFYVDAEEDQELAIRIQQAHAATPRTDSSPEELCTYLRTVVKSSRDSCKDYPPLPSALLDLQDNSRSPLPCSVSTSTLWQRLLYDTATFLRAYTQPVWEVDLGKAHIIYVAWALVQELKIDREFTLEQNLNILWIHVLTMEMVARLRGCLQQRLILKALRDRMRSSQKIYLI